MDRDYRIGSNFWKFYLIRSGFTLGEAVSLGKVVRLLRLERDFFWCSECGSVRGQSEAAPTSAPTWMDGALIGFSFLSLCHPRLTFFVCPFLALFQAWSQFFFATLFSPHPNPILFIYLFSFETFPTQPPTTPHCPPPTYSPIYLN
jgi:hypothetical protein